MTGLFSKLIDYMEEEEFKYEILEGETVIRFNFKGTPAGCSATATWKRTRTGSSSTRTCRSARPRRRSARRRVRHPPNRGMRIGNFELDYEDGEIRYKTSLESKAGN